MSPIEGIPSGRARSYTNASPAGWMRPVADSWKEPRSSATTSSRPPFSSENRRTRRWACSAAARLLTEAGSRAFMPGGHGWQPRLYSTVRSDLIPESERPFKAELQLAEAMSSIRRPGGGRSQCGVSLGARKRREGNEREAVLRRTRDASSTRRAVNRACSRSSSERSETSVNRDSRTPVTTRSAPGLRRAV